MNNISKQNSCSAMLKIADAKFKKGDYEAAAVAYSEVLALYPANMKALSRLKTLKKRVSGQDEKSSLDLKQIDAAHYLELFALVVFLAGIIQLLLGIVKLGNIADFILKSST